jgi:hypothetical protein
MLKLLTSLGLLFLWSISYAQEISISPPIVDEAGIITFDLSILPAASDRERYDVNLYASADNYQEAVEQLKGIRVNEKQVIRINGSEKLGEYEGSLTFKATAVASVFPVQMDESGKKKFTKGKKVNLTWTDYHDVGSYTIELYQGVILKETLARNYQGTTFTQKLPKDLEKGNYQLKVTPAGRQELSSEAYPVVVAAGLSPLLIGGGVLVVGGGILAATGGGGESVSGTDELPDPPGPPSGN